MTLPTLYDPGGSRTSMMCKVPVSYQYDGGDELLTETGTRAGAAYTDVRHHDRARQRDGHAEHSLPAPLDKHARFF